MIPLVDLAAQHASIADEIADGFARVFAQSTFILGDEVARFERSFAEFSGVEHCIGVASGTDALELCVRALGLGPGDEVIVPTNSFAASALAILRAGAQPAFCDIDPHTFLMDVADVEKRIGPNTKAILPVHLYGQLAPMEDVVTLAESAGLIVIEDAAQAQGARRKGRAAGTWGIVSGTSFYPAKNLGAYGDAGAVLTDSDSIANKIFSLRNYGAERKYEHTEIGFNSRLDTLQAVVLNVKLRRLSHWNEQRRVAADRYGELLDGLKDVTLPEVLPGNDHVWHLFVVRVPERDLVLKSLNEAGIGAGVHYPSPIHLQRAFASFGYQAGDFPQAERAAREVLSLPLYPEITAEQQLLVAETLRGALRS